MVMLAARGCIKCRSNLAVYGCEHDASNSSIVTLAENGRKRAGVRCFSFFSLNTNIPEHKSIGHVTFNSEVLLQIRPMRQVERNCGRIRAGEEFLPSASKHRMGAGKMVGPSCYSWPWCGSAVRYGHVVLLNRRRANLVLSHCCRESPCAFPH
jgi:hypothetical protein